MGGQNVVPETPVDARPSTRPDTDEEWDRLMDDMQVLIQLRAGQTVTQDDVDALNRLDAYWRESEEHVLDAYARGHKDALRHAGGDALAEAVERADMARMRLVTERALRKLDRQWGFRDGARACREMMARFVAQGGDASTAASIRANWHPAWGEDPTTPSEDDDLSGRPLGAEDETPDDASGMSEPLRSAADLAEGK